MPDGFHNPQQTSLTPFSGAELKDMLRVGRTFFNDTPELKERLFGTDGSTVEPDVLNEFLRDVHYVSTSGVKPLRFVPVRSAADDVWRDSEEMKVVAAKILYRERGYEQPCEWPQVWFNVKRGFETPQDRERKISKERDRLQDQFESLCRFNRNWTHMRREAGDGPPYYELKERVFRYRESEITAWAQATMCPLPRELKGWIDDNKWRPRNL